MKVSELSGAQLDYWVAKCEGRTARIAEYTDDKLYCVVPAGIRSERGWTSQSEYSPSSTWSLGGPIIERERIVITPWNDESGATNWEATVFERRAAPLLSSERSKWGATPLIASMRCYVASKLGEELPDEVCS